MSISHQIIDALLGLHEGQHEPDWQTDGIKTSGKHSKFSFGRNHEKEQKASHILLQTGFPMDLMGEKKWNST